MVVQGGELAFIRAMIADSQQLRARVYWYSSMCGKKASLKVLRQELHNAGGLLLMLIHTRILLFTLYVLLQYSTRPLKL